ncbi:hypothetical protein [Maricaulis sp.]|uniref:hypothetical protein n=1 Tax=Maricaulis sp. TaxID=1486257 RepID=UPI003A9580FB
MNKTVMWLSLALLIHVISSILLAAIGWVGSEWMPLLLGTGFISATASGLLSFIFLDASFAPKITRIAGANPLTLLLRNLLIVFVSMFAFFLVFLTHFIPIRCDGDFTNPCYATAVYEVGIVFVGAALVIAIGKTIRTFLN